MLALAAVFEGGLGVTAWVLGRATGQPVETRWRWDGWDAALGVAACVPMLVLFAACLRCPFEPLVRIRRVLNELVGTLFASATLVDLALVSALAGVGEELLFRGIFQEACGRRLGPGAGLLLASIVFGLAHALTAGYAFVAFLMGLYLGGLWMGTGNLLVPAVTHAVYDFVSLVVLTRGRRRNAARGRGAPEP